MNTDMNDNHKKNSIDGVEEAASTASKLRAFIAGLTPSAIFKYTFATSVIIVLAAGIIWHVATDSKHVNIDKVETATVVLSGSDDLGGISPDGYKAVSYGITNNSTSPAYVFIRIEMATPDLYEVVDCTDWCELTGIENENEIILGYGESSELTPVGIGEEVEMMGRLHCLADAVQYSTLTGTDMDIDVEACLVYGTSDDGAEVVYNTSAGSLWQAYSENR